MIKPRRHPLPSTVEELEVYFIVKDVSGSGASICLSRGRTARRSAAKLITYDEARRIAANIANLPNLLCNRQWPVSMIIGTSILRHAHCR